MKNYTLISNKYLSLQKRRTILTIIGIILSVSLISSIGTLFMSFREMQIDSIKQSGDYHFAYKDISKDKVDKILNNVNVEEGSYKYKSGFALPIESQNAQINKSKDDNFKYFELTKYSDKAFKMFPSKLNEGKIPSANNEIMLEYWVLDMFKTKPKIGDKIQLNIGIVTKDGKELQEELLNNGQFNIKTTEEFTLVGLTKPDFISSSSDRTPAIAYTSEITSQSENKFSSFIRISNPSDAKKIAETIAMQADLPKVNNTYKIEYNESLLAFYASSTSSSVNSGFILVAIFLIILILIATIAVIYNSFNISVLERISQFGVIRCIGATPAQIRKIVFKEAFIMALIGIPLGLFFGVFAMKIVFMIINEILISNLNADIEGLEIVISLPLMLISSLIGFCTILLSAYGPARKAGKVSPLEAIRNTGGFRKENFKKVKRVFLSKFLFKIEGELASKNIKRNRKRFRITVFSMVISITLYIVFTTFSESLFNINPNSNSFKPSFSVNNNERKFDLVSIKNSIKGFDATDKIYHKYYNFGTSILNKDKINPKLSNFRQFNDIYNDTSLKLDSNSAAIYTTFQAFHDDNTLLEYKNYLKEGKIDLNEINSENGVLIFSKYKLLDTKEKKYVILDSLKVKVGDYIDILATSIPSNEAQKVKEVRKKVKVVGIIDKNILGEEFLISNTLMITTNKVIEKICPDPSFDELLITTKDDSDTSKISKFLTDYEKSYPYFSYEDGIQAAKNMKNVGIVFNIFIYGFIGVITLICCLNITNTLSTSILLRKKELSMLKAVGMTEGSIRKMISLEGLQYGIYASIYGSIIGIILSYILYTFLIRLTDFEWHTPWDKVIIATVGALLVALISSLIPLSKLKKGNLIDNIRTVD